MKIFLLTAAAVVRASFENDGKSPTVVLDTYSFKDYLKTNENVLVTFYAPWCNKCKQFMPEVEKAAEILQSETPPMSLAKVDCTNEDNVDLCIEEGVKGYPQVTLYKNGQNTGDNPSHLRSNEQIQKFMRTKLSFPSYPIKTKEDFFRFTDHPKGALIGLFEEDGEEKKSWYKKAYNKIVKALVDEFRFGHITDIKLAKDLFTTKENPEGLWNHIVYHRPLNYKSNFEPNYFIYDNEKLTAGLLKTWVKGKGVGLCPVLNEDDFHSMTPPFVMAYYQVDFQKDLKGSRYWRNRVMKVAKDFPQYQFAVGARKNFENQILDDLGGNADWGQKAPKIVLWDERWDSYRMEIGQNCDPVCDLDPDGSNLRAFLDQYEKGELTNFVKSAEPPENNDGPVKVVVGKTFDEIVLDETKDVLIEFYAPWCGHCKSLEPIWNELGEKLMDDANIVIAKMDATANHPPKFFSYQGFPTIFWAGMGNKKHPKKYEGSRTLDAFIEFIKGEAKVTPLRIKGESNDEDNFDENEGSGYDDYYDLEDYDDYDEIDEEYDDIDYDGDYEDDEDYNEAYDDESPRKHEEL